MIETITGNILKFEDAQYIAHQCNCVSEISGGLAYSLFNKYHWANTYIDKAFDRKPGEISVHGDGAEERFVVNMYSQFYPGFAQHQNDSSEKRLGWFKSCLSKIAQIKGLRSIAFPYNIGCGLAGGDWEDYYNSIVLFGNTLKNVEVYIVKLKN